MTAYTRLAQQHPLPLAAKLPTLTLTFLDTYQSSLGTPLRHCDLVRGALSGALELLSPLIY